MGGLDYEGVLPPPISEQPPQKVGADAKSIEREVRRRMDAYWGEERVAMIVDFMCTTLIEVIETRPFKPSAVERENNDNVQLIRSLAGGILPSRPKQKNKPPSVTSISTI